MISLTTSSVAQTVASNDRMIYELERPWKEATVALFKVLTQHLPEGLKKTTGNVSQDSQSAGRDVRSVT
jgi:hypothetical protein